MPSVQDQRVVGVGPRYLAAILESARTIAVRWRRWLTVTFIAIAFLSVWWYWPRGDARFVGKWALYHEGDSRRHGVITFRRNGRMWRDEQTGWHGLETSWEIRGNYLWMGPRSHIHQQLLVWLSGPYFVLTGESLVYRPSKKRIEDVSADAFQVVDDLGKSRVFYRRIPE